MKKLFHSYTSQASDPWWEMDWCPLPDAIKADRDKIVVVYTKHHVGAGWRHIYCFERNAVMELSTDLVWNKGGEVV